MRCVKVRHAEQKTGPAQCEQVPAPGDAPGMPGSPPALWLGAFPRHVHTHPRSPASDPVLQAVSGVRLEAILRRLQNSLSSEHLLGGGRTVYNPVRARCHPGSPTSEGQGPQPGAHTGCAGSVEGSAPEPQELGVGAAPRVHT